MRHTCSSHAPFIHTMDGLTPMLPMDILRIFGPSRSESANTLPKWLRRISTSWRSSGRSYSTMDRGNLLEAF